MAKRKEGPRKFTREALDLGQKTSWIVRLTPLPIEQPPEVFDDDQLGHLNGLRHAPKEIL